MLQGKKEKGSRAEISFPFARVTSLWGWEEPEAVNSLEWLCDTWETMQSCSLSPFKCSLTYIIQIVTRNYINSPRLCHCKSKLPPRALVKLWYHTVWFVQTDKPEQNDYCWYGWIAVGGNIWIVVDEHTMEGCGLDRVECQVARMA